MDIKYHFTYQVGSVKYFVLHHAGGLGNDRYAPTQHLTVKNIDNAHKARWAKYANTWSAYKSSLGYYVGYNFYIEKDGKITQTRAIGEETAHTKGFNKQGVAVGICLAGNFLSYERPTLAQIIALKNLLRSLPPISVRKVVPHRYLQRTACNGNLPNNWGRLIYQEVIGEKLNAIMQILVSILDILRNRKLKVGSVYKDCNELDLI